MRKLLLALALTLTAGNLALGAYAAVCESVKGARACGTDCTGGADGTCKCTGGCSTAEMNWVAGGGSGGEELLAE